MPTCPKKSVCQLQVYTLSGEICDAVSSATLVWQPQMATALQMNFFSWAHCGLIGKAERLTVTDIVINYPSSVTLQSFIAVGFHIFFAAVIRLKDLEGLCQATLNIQLLQLKF